MLTSFLVISLLPKAIPKNKDEEIDSLLDILDKQSYIPRLTFLIYPKTNYFYKDNYSKRYRYFYLSEDFENRYKFERVVFQRQRNKKLGIVIHTRNLDLIENYLKEKDEDKFKLSILKIFNELFEDNSYINQLFDYEDISIMHWRASQPLEPSVPSTLQFCSRYKIGFCGDWINEEGFGRIEGAILSGLKLAKKFQNLIY